MLRGGYNLAKFTNHNHNLTKRTVHNSKVSLDSVLDYVIQYNSAGKDARNVCEKIAETEKSERSGQLL